ncbi:hypothetical protein CHUAL_006303 [Chamberlinius hualienensis]
MVTTAIEYEKPNVLAYLIRNQGQLRYDELLMFQTCYQKCSVELLEKVFALIVVTSPARRLSHFVLTTNPNNFDADKYRLLIHYGANILTVRDDGYTVFHVAILQNCPKALQMLLENIDANGFHELNLELTNQISQRNESNMHHNWGNVFQYVIRRGTAKMVSMVLPYINEAALNSWIGRERIFYDKFMAIINQNQA